MSFLLFGLIGGLIVAIPTRHRIQRGSLRPWFVVSAIMAAFWAAIAYMELPQFVGPFYGIATVLMVLAALGIRARAHAREDIIVEPVEAILFCCLVLIVAVRVIAGSAMVRSDDYHAFVQRSVHARDLKGDMAPADPTRIRVVGIEQATWKANVALGKAAGNLGSQYQLGAFAIQKIGNELVWVAPLEYQDFPKWFTLDSTPGYVRVSAEDAAADARVVVGKKFVYMKSAFFHQNLERHVYAGGHQFRGVADPTFEVDDRGKAYWVAALYEPTIQYGGDEVTGVVIVDPETGAMKDYAMKDVPAWVDHVIPEWIARERITWYGKYVHGWRNATFGKENNVVRPATIEGSDAFQLVWGDDGRPYWFTGFTSVQRGEGSLAGFFLMDARTGATRQYEQPGLTETAVLANVNSKVSNFRGYYGTRPVLANLYGNLVWVVPVITGQGFLQRVALMDAVSNEVVLGDTGKEAVDAYRRLLNGEKGARNTIQGTIRRIAADTRAGNTTYYVVLVEDPEQRIFTGTSTLSVKLPIAVPGDKVVIEHGATTDTTVPMSSFDLPDLVPARPETIDVDIVSLPLAVPPPQQ